MGPEMGVESGRVVPRYIDVQNGAISRSPYGAAGRAGERSHPDGLRVAADSGRDDEGLDDRGSSGSWSDIAVGAGR